MWVYIQIYGTSSTSYIPVHKSVYRLCPVERQRPPILEPFFQLKFSTILPAIIETLGDGPFSKKYSMKRTGNICVDRQCLSNAVLLWTAVTVDAQHAVHPTTLSLCISQVLSGICLWKPLVVKNGFDFLNYITEGWMLVVCVLLCKWIFHYYYLLEKTGMWFHSYGEKWFHHTQDHKVRYFQYCFNPSAWGYLIPSQNCDVGSFFYEVFKFRAKLYRSLFKIM